MFFLIYVPAWNLNIRESFHFEDKSFRFTVSSIRVNLAMSGYGGSIFCWISVVETEGSQVRFGCSCLTWFRFNWSAISLGYKLSAGLFSLVHVCANCSWSFSEDSLIFLNISFKVLTLSLGLEPDIFTLRNSPTTVLLTVNDKLVNVSIHF